jgi:hypothetical protein
VEEDEVDGTFHANGGERNMYRFLVRKPEGKRSLGKPRRRWMYNIKMDLIDRIW